MNVEQEDVLPMCKYGSSRFEVRSRSRALRLGIAYYEYSVCIYYKFYVTKKKEKKRRRKGLRMVVWEGENCFL